MITPRDITANTLEGYQNGECVHILGSVDTDTDLLSNLNVGGSAVTGGVVYTFIRIGSNLWVPSVDF